jgi:hypothetical protein
MEVVVLRKFADTSARLVLGDQRLQGDLATLADPTKCRSNRASVDVQEFENSPRRSTSMPDDPET